MNTKRKMKGQRKPAGYRKDVRTAWILDMVGKSIGVNLATNYLAGCHAKTIRAYLKQKKGTQ